MFHLPDVPALISCGVLFLHCCRPLDTVGSCLFIPFSLYVPHVLTVQYIV